MTTMIRQHRDSVSHGLLAIVLALLAALLAPALGQAAAGDLDRSFGGDGKLSTDFGSPHEGATSVAIDSQGRLVAAGSGNNSCCYASLIARYAPDGTLDRSFSGDGVVMTDLENYSPAAIDSQDRIVVAGHTCNYEQSHCDFALRRYNPDGRLDPSFSGDGKVTTNIGGSGWATSVAIDPQGRIVAAGGRGHYKGHIALARYNPNGTLDPSFSGDGVLLARRGDRGHSIRAWPPFGLAVGPQGGIVIAGYAENETDLADFALVRYNSNGTVNQRFGEVSTDFAFSDHAAAAAVGPGWTVVAAGDSYQGGSVGDTFALARYNPDGSLDRSFSGDGKLTTRFALSGHSGDEAADVVIDSRGRIVAAGHDDYTGFALARYNPDGSLDSSFGKVTTTFPDSPAGNGANSVAIDSQGRIVAAGLGGGDFALARYIGYP